MNIQEMHYDFKQKLNKIDSQKYRNLLVPEIDWKLNEALGILIKAVAFPRQNRIIGFEINQRIKDDLRSLVKEQFLENNDCLSVTKINDLIYKTSIPSDYQYYIKSFVNATKDTCTRKLIGLSKNHGDRNEQSAFNNSSFEWEEANILFVGNDLHAYTDNTFIINNVCLTYYKIHPYMHNAKDFNNGSYKMIDGVTILTGSQDCILPVTVHSDIVDIAVLITTGDLISNYEIKQGKTKITE